MSLDKFLSLLNDRQLYFARQDTFFDLQEGKRSVPDLAMYDEAVPGISDIIENDPYGCAFINCWVMSDVDLYLMWSTYSSLDKGIAIKSTIGNLKDSLDPTDEREIYISDVHYIDYSNKGTFIKANGSANDLARYFCKRKYFQQEQELRLVYYNYKMRLDDNNTPSGLKFSVSLDTLIDEFWIAPQADVWYGNLIKEEIKTHGLVKPIRRSHI
ncbi:MAG: DUF2971 domain-containing protein [Prevotella sp.]|nr:DUF2971 domain-containing protein [Prevotella sp.]